MRSKNYFSQQANFILHTIKLFCIFVNHSDTLTIVRNSDFAGSMMVACERATGFESAFFITGIVMEYEEFLKNKIIIAENYGIDTAEIEYSKMLFPHQKDIVNFCLLGGRDTPSNFFCTLFYLGECYGALLCEVRIVGRL